MRILAVVLEIILRFTFLRMPVSIYNERYDMPYSFQVHIFWLIKLFLTSPGLPRVLEYRRHQWRCADVTSGVAYRDPQNTWNRGKTADLS